MTQSLKSDEETVQELSAASNDAVQALSPRNFQKALCGDDRDSSTDPSPTINDDSRHEVMDDTHDELRDTVVTFLASMREITGRLSSCPTLVEAESTTLEWALRYLQSEAGWIALRSDETLSLPITLGAFPLSWNTVSPWSHYVFEHGVPLTDNTLGAGDPAVNMRNILVVPLLHHRQCFGVVGFCNRPGDFRPDDAEAVQTMLFPLVYRLAHGPLAPDDLFTTAGLVDVQPGITDDLLTQAFRLSPVGAMILQVEPAGTVLAINPAMQQVLGEKKLNFGKAVRLDALFSEQTTLQMQTMVAACIARGETVTYPSVVVKTGCGAERSFSCSFTPMRCNQGQTKQVLCSFCDVTEQERVRQELGRISRMSERRARELRAILDTLDDTVLVLEAIDNRVIGNESALRWFPELFDTLFQENFTSSFSFYDAAGNKLALQQIPLIRALHGERIAKAMLTVDTAEGRRNFRCNALPIISPEGVIERAVMMMHNVTESPQMPVRGQQSTPNDITQLLSILEHIPFGILIAQGKEPTQLSANAAARALLGGDVLPTLVGYHFSSKSAVRPVSGNANGCSGLELALVGIEGEEELKVILSDRERVLRMTYGPLCDADGSQYGAIAQLQDITDERDLERAKEEFICITSHELQSPLTVIKGYAEQLLWSQQQQLPMSLVDSLQAIDRQVVRMRRLISDLLDISAAEINKLQLELGAVDLSELIRKISHDVAMIHQRMVNQELIPGLIIRCDALRVEQIIRNLLDNAFKYSPPHTEVTVKLRTWEHEVEVIVSDQGDGIPSEEIAQLFTPFYRAKLARKNKPTAGFGLGLALTNHLVRKHGGKITVESIVGVGSTFHVFLPR
ncbi:MAG TPA: ATP-binding protein [Armatimonadota bacterium]|nr:ATP-binding protein [Armatimonadota bacterium]